MSSATNNYNFTALTLKKYLLKLRAYSNYLCGLILVQAIALALGISSSPTMGMSSAGVMFEVHSFSAQLVLTLSAAWVFMVSIVLSTRSNKDASFSFPGNRTSDTLSDIAYILTGCLFGGVTCALSGVALRLEPLLFHQGNVLFQGFYPQAGQLCVIAAAAFLYMLMLSAVGYFSGTLFRISKVFIPVVTVLLIYAFLSVLSKSNSLPLWAKLFYFLFKEGSLGIFALGAAACAVILYGLSTVISNFTEVRK